MQSYADGKNVERRLLGRNDWHRDTAPQWDWSKYEYRQEETFYKKALRVLGEADLASIKINFSAVEDWNNAGETKILYDTHIRNTLKENLEIDKQASFLLVPITNISTKLTNMITENIEARKQEKGQA